MTIAERLVLLDRFVCKGSACEDTCCRGWDMQVDPPHLELYRREQPELAAAVDDRGDGPVMRREGSDGTCLKLSGGLCSIHASLGLAYLGDACHFYPRVVRRLGDRTRMSATLSCPEVARLALFDDAPSMWTTTTFDRLPWMVRDAAPEGLDATSAVSVCDAFLSIAVDESLTPERALRVIVSIARSLGRLPAATWGQSIGLLARIAPGGLCPAECDGGDAIRLLHALLGLIRASRHKPGSRLRELTETIEHALGVTVDRATLDVWSGPDGPDRRSRLDEAMAENRAILEPILRRWLMAQLLAGAFPYAGLGSSPADRATILGVRFATLRLALAAHAVSEMLEGPTIVRIVQGLSRFLDHLAEPMLSLALYRDVGWLRETRLAGLIEGRQVLPGKTCSTRQVLPGETSAMAC